ncbi:hypothetical protein LTR64_000300 [Lithohypha guttulata]|uniref:uncharacterized protein n=1 Tax=Lithohypha guttulata TaxID=1690604 RepID=UPI002DE0B421|nr:hypothetical protein LTR51_007661 [Lithohypha guttulata]
MSDLDPQAPSQPNQQTGLNQAQNAAQKTQEEKDVSKDTSSLNSKPIDHREQHDVPSHHGDDAMPSSLGRGDTGSLKEKKLTESDKERDGVDPNLEGEQMRMPGEGDVADAVKTGGGGGHAEEPSLTDNLDAKADEHEKELHARGQRTGAEIEEEEKEDWTGKKADIGEALAGRGNKVVLAPEE